VSTTFLFVVDFNIFVCNFTLHIWQLKFFVILTLKKKGATSSTTFLFGG
jgi:hypothetical protein